MWILFLNTDGTVKSHQKISDTQGGFTGTLENGDAFGVSVASLGDLDGDGVGDLAVGASQSTTGGGKARGAVWVLFLNTDGTVKSHQKISDTEGGFTGTLNDSDRFGRSVASLGDLDGDGVTDLAVGAWHDNDGGIYRGAVWVLFLDGVPACLGDITGDNQVDLEDLVILLSNYATPSGETYEDGDLDGDGDVDLADLALMLSNFGLTC